MTSNGDSRETREQSHTSSVNRSTEQWTPMDEIGSRSDHEPFELRQDVWQWAPGTQVDQYAIVSEIGRGGMGTVYRAKDAEGNCVAIKVTRLERLGARNTDIRIEKEIRALLDCQHDNVLRLIDLPTYQGQQLLVTQFVDGPDLHAYIQQNGPLPFRSAAEVFLGLLDGLNAIHLQGIVHRDLKPGNILLRKETSTSTSDFSKATGVIADFGLSRALEQSRSMQITRVEATIGTPPFMPPEQFGENRVADPRSDLFAIAATFYFALTGVAPLEVDTIAQYKRSYQDPDFDWRPALEKLPNNESLQAFFQKALAIDPRSRFQSAMWMREELQRSLLGRPSRLIQVNSLPDQNGDFIGDVSFRWELKSKPDEVWEYLADTNQVNRWLNLPAPKFKKTNRSESHDVKITADRSKPDLSPDWLQQAVAKTKFGQLAWLEYPFEWTVGQFHHVLRQFDNGPFHWIQSRLELQSTETDTGAVSLLNQRFRFRSRSRLHHWLALAHLHWQVAPKLEKIYRQIDLYANSRQLQSSTRLAVPFAVQADLTEFRKSIDTYVQRLTDHRIAPTLTSNLAEYLAGRTPIQLSVIRPLEFAATYKHLKTEAIRAFLAAVRCGLLLMRWSVLCPVCRVETKRVNRLAALESHLDCDYCQHEGKLDLVRQVELVFELSPDLANVDHQTYCIGGPFHLPHVVAQRIVPVDSVLEVSLQLPAGLYQISGPQFPTPQPFEILDRSNGLHFAEVNLEQLGSSQIKEKLSADSQVLLLRNDGDQDLLVRIEKLEDVTKRLLLAEALGLKEFSDWFPEQLVDSHELTLKNVRYLMKLNFNDCSTFSEQLKCSRTAVGIVETCGGEVLGLQDSRVLMAAFDSSGTIDRAAAQITDAILAKITLVNCELESGFVGSRLVHQAHRIENSPELLKPPIDFGQTFVDSEIYQKLIADNASGSFVASCNASPYLASDGGKYYVLSPKEKTTG